MIHLDVPLFLTPERPLVTTEICMSLCLFRRTGTSGHLKGFSLLIARVGPGGLRYFSRENVAFWRDDKLWR